MEYDFKPTIMQDGTGEYECTLETAPLTVGRQHPFHSFLNQILNIKRIGVFVEGDQGFQYRVDSNTEFKDASWIDLSGNSMITIKGNVVLIPTLGKMTPGRGLQFKLNPKAGGCICGVVIYTDLEEVGS